MRLARPGVRPKAARRDRLPVFWLTLYAGFLRQKSPLGNAGREEQFETPEEWQLHARRDRPARGGQGRIGCSAPPSDGATELGSEIRIRCAAWPWEERGPARRPAMRGRL